MSAQTTGMGPSSPTRRIGHLATDCSSPIRARWNNLGPGGVRSERDGQRAGLFLSIPALHLLLQYKPRPHGRGLLLAAAG